MSTGPRLPLQEAMEIAQEVSRRLTPLTARLKCVGSVRRQKETVGDIEFLAEPAMHSDLFGGETPVLNLIREALHDMGTWVKGGDRMMQITDLLKHPGLKLDLFLVHPPSTWGSQLAIRTGPAAMGYYVVTACQRFGIRHANGFAARVATGERIPTDTEEQFFALAEVACVPPSEREALARRLWAELNVGQRKEVAHG